MEDVRHLSQKGRYQSLQSLISNVCLTPAALCYDCRAFGYVCAAVTESHLEDDSFMTYVVAEPCVNCRYTDCAVVCPVDAFHIDDDMLVINPET